MIDSLLGLELHAVELEHKDELSEFLRRYPHALSGYTFAALFSWKLAFQYGWALCGDDALIVTARIDPELDRHLLQPLGPLSPACADVLLAAARELPYRLRVVGVDERFLAENPEFVARFEVQEDRANANYIHLAEDLADLAGRRFAKKRNLIAQAQRQYSFTVEPLTADNAMSACEILRRIHEQEPEWQLTPALRHELNALEHTILHFAALDLEGVLVRVNGEPAGFSMFESQTPDVAVIHFERALRSHKGLHQIVTRAAAQAIRSRGFTYLNREEDLGNEGLRQAKLSYNPFKIEMSYQLLLRR